MNLLTRFFYLYSFNKYFKLVLLNLFILSKRMATLHDTRWFIRLMMVVGMFAIGSPDVFSQNQKPYTSNDLISMALEYSPQVLAARDQYQTFQGQLSTAKAIPNPEFEFNTGQQRSVTGSLPVGNVSSWTIHQPLDMPYTRSPRVNAAQANLNAAEATRLAFEIDLIARVKQRFYDLMRSQAQAKAAEEDLNLTKQIRDRMQVRYDQGETARFEFIRTQTEYLNAKINAESSNLRVEQARSQLRQVVGHQLPSNFSVVAEQPKTETLPPLAELMREIHEQSPELQRAQAEVEASEYRLSTEQNARLPKLSLKAQQYNDPSYTDRLFGLVVQIPIWDWKRGPIAEAQANRSKAKNQLNFQIQTLETQLEIAYQQYQLISSQVKILDQEVVTLAASAGRIAEISYRYGERGMLEYLDAQRTFRTARNDLIKSRFDLINVITEIQRLRANPDWLLQIKGNQP